jgi:hypothetical protein
MSTRDMVNFTMQKAAGVSFRQMEKTYFATWTDEEKKKVKAEMK